MRLTRTPKTILLVAVILWLFTVGAGLRLILGYEISPGKSGTSPTEWPADSQILRRPGVPTLVMMIHPHCPCSRASIGELALLMVEGQGLLDANVVFVKPKDFSEEWAKTDLWSSVASIPGVKVSIDNGGIEANHFGSQTSGQVVLYSAQGQLLFSGGITAARGHAGDNDGRSAIVALLTHGDIGKRGTPVFGCALFGETSRDKSKDFCDAIHSK
jgi:hypothetical protein